LDGPEERRWSGPGVFRRKAPWGSKRGEPAARKPPEQKTCLGDQVRDADAHRPPSRRRKTNPRRQGRFGTITTTVRGRVSGKSKPTYGAKERRGSSRTTRSGNTPRGDDGAWIKVFREKSTEKGSDQQWFEDQ